ncbi:unnamed protein product [Adineta steineri]|uniref:TIR domain-containing protein n=1 Tax=Adineta steineri TaxID=433720 RepID=A0A814YWT9_9BILA|nr:unnamed protein product [Adineta steineri]CAF3757784.1 unnamed protein product [Adineta steineri]
MATAVELSDVIFICMSDPYKQSTYYRSDAEYAYTRQRHIIPLVMEKKISSRWMERLSSIENSYNDRFIEWWTHEDVLSFLYDKYLDVIRTLFEYEQQFDGHSLYILYKQCQSNTQSTYQVLNTQLNQPHDRTLPYFTYIHFFSELEKQFNPLDIKQYIRYLLWIIYAKILQNFFKKILNN